MTYLGASRVEPEVAAAMAEASQAFVDMAALQDRAGTLLAEATGAEAGLVVASAAAGIVTGVAAALTCGHPALAWSLPRGVQDKRVVLLKAHAINFGAPLTTLLAMMGAAVDEVGQVNAVSTFELAARVQGRGDAVFIYVVSHHIDAQGSMALPEVLAICHQAGVPVIVDAAAETDLKKYVSAGADLVIYSGHKAVRGPTSGMLVGRRDLIQEAAWHQAQGIGRAMKVSKEQVAGLLTGLRLYQDQSAEELQKVWNRRLKALDEKLRVVCDTRLEGPDARGIPRLAVRGTPQWARDLVAWLEIGRPSIRT